MGTTLPMTKGGMGACVTCVIARATRGDEGGGGVAREETGKWVSRDVRSDGRVGCYVTATLPAVSIALEAPPLGAMQPCRPGLVDVEGHYMSFLSSTYNSYSTHARLNDRVRKHSRTW